MMKRPLLVLLTIGLIGSLVASAEAGEGSERTERTVEANYYGAQLLYQYRSCVLSGGAGCVVIQTSAGENSLTARATDAHGQPVSVWVVDASERQDELDGANRVYGTFCGETTEPIRFEPGTTLELWIGGEWWPRWWIVPKVPECFPGAASTGTISVLLSGSKASEGPGSREASPGPAESPAPQPSPSVQPEVVERSVDLALRRHLRGFGSVVAEEASCRSDVPVIIQKRTSGTWRDVASTTTDTSGVFAVSLADRSGPYRVMAPELISPVRTCLGDMSAVVRHRH